VVESRRAAWVKVAGSDHRGAETWAIRAKGQQEYALSVHGPNGFFRFFKGSIRGADKANLSVDVDFKFDQGVTLEIKNESRRPAHLRIYDAYAKRTIERAATAHQHVIWHFDTDASFGWYDLTIEVAGDSSFKQQLAGHVENGCDSMSDPLLGA
jgi:phospholipase C